MVLDSDTLHFSDQTRIVLQVILQFQMIHNCRRNATNYHQWKRHHLPFATKSRTFLHYWIYRPYGSDNSNQHPCLHIQTQTFPINIQQCQYFLRAQQRNCAGLNTILNCRNIHQNQNFDEFKSDQTHRLWGISNNWNTCLGKLNRF